MGETIREQYLSYLCGISEDYIKQHWGPILKRSLWSLNWDDPLIKFYERTAPMNRVRNAVHLYLVFKTRLVRLRKRNNIYVGEEFIDKERDEAVCKAVDEDIFSPRTKKIIETNNLERILGSRLPSEKRKDISPEERLLTCILPKTTDYQRALWQIESLLYDQLEKTYDRGGKINLDKVYAEFEEEIFHRIRYGLILAGDGRVRKYFESLQKRWMKELHKETQKHLSKHVEELLESLSPREEKILRMRYGIGNPSKFKPRKKSK